jgi:hypothetical protein
VEQGKQTFWHVLFNPPVVIVSLILFSFFGPYWPVLVILFGLWMMLRVLINKR